MTNIPVQTRATLLPVVRHCVHMWVVPGMVSGRCEGDGGGKDRTAPKPGLVELLEDPLWSQLFPGVQGLSHFLPKRHSPQQVGYTGGDGERAVAVRRVRERDTLTARAHGQRQGHRPRSPGSVMTMLHGRTHKIKRPKCHSAIETDNSAGRLNRIYESFDMIGEVF